MIFLNLTNYVRENHGGMWLYIDYEVKAKYRTVADDVLARCSRESHMTLRGLTYAHAQFSQGTCERRTVAGGCPGQGEA